MMLWRCDRIHREALPVAVLPPRLRLAGVASLNGAWRNRDPSPGPLEISCSGKGDRPWLISARDPRWGIWPGATGAALVGQRAWRRRPTARLILVW